MLISASPATESAPPECPEPVSLAGYLLTRFQRIIGTDVDHAEYATLVGDIFTNQVKLRLETKSTKPTIRDKILEAVRAATAAECWQESGSCHRSDASCAYNVE
jgi:hypothetical protein